MAQTVGNVLHAGVPVALQGVEDVCGELAVGEFFAATDVLRGTGLAAVEHHINSLAVVINV